MYTIFCLGVIYIYIIPKYFMYFSISSSSFTENILLKHLFPKHYVRYRRRKSEHNRHGRSLCHEACYTSKVTLRATLEILVD